MSDEQTPTTQEEAAQRPHISPSQLARYFTCGEQYRRIYVMKERRPPGIALLKGTAVHGAAESNNRAKLVTRQDLPEATMVEAAVATLEERISVEGLELTREESALGQKAVVGKATDSVARLASLYAREVAPGLMPALVEHSVRVELPGLRDIVGRIDVVDEQEIIRDLKTSGRAKSADDLETDQLAFYAAAYEVTTGRLPAAVQLDVLVDTKVPKSQQLRATRNAQDKVVLAARVNAMLMGLEAGVFLPATPGHWACTPKFCGFWDTCPYVNAARRAAAEAQADA